MYSSIPSSEMGDARIFELFESDWSNLFDSDWSRLILLGGVRLGFGIGLVTWIGDGPRGVDRLLSAGLLLVSSCSRIRLTRSSSGVRVGTCISGSSLSADSGSVESRRRIFLLLSLFFENRVS